MVAEHTEPAVSFNGTKAQKEVAERAFQALRARGMFGSSYAPIQVSLASLEAYLTSDSEVRADTIHKALAANDQVFALITVNDEAYVVTSRQGTPPLEMRLDNRHSFPERFITPEPAPERPLRTAKPVPKIVINAEIAAQISDTRDEIASVERDLEVLDGITAPPEREMGGVTLERLAKDVPPVVEEAPVADIPGSETDEPVAAEAPVAPDESTLKLEEVEEEAAPEPEVVPEDIAPVAEVVAAEPEEVEQQAAELVVEETPEPVAVVAPPVSQPEPIVEEVAAPAPVPARQLSDFSGFTDDALSAAIQERIEKESRFARFGDRWMAEDQLVRLSRGNLRRIADDINEQERPLTDDVLAQDVLGARRSSPDFATIRFALNYRLSSERGFEFIGTHDQPFWGTTELSAIGTTRRKASDIGTDYRYLVDEAPLGSIDPRSATSVEHTLSFYEFTYGLLPLDEKLQSLLPAPVMAEQRAAVITVEIPQFENSVYLVEVRYPTQTRGGFLLGLDDFYEEKLVPGAMLSIQATDNDGHYKIEYLEDDEQQDRFLELDDRRAAKYVFRPLTYDTAVSSEWLVTEGRFPRLSSEKPLSERRRRRIEDVVEATFERVGEQNGKTWTATFDDVLVAVNIERPASETSLRSAIEGMPSVSDDGSGILTYDSAS